jgi:hypothetical protein
MKQKALRGKKEKHFMLALNETKGAERDEAEEVEAQQI